MLFTSGAFILFFAVFFALYWFVAGRNLKAQNLLLLAGSYFFYAWADWRFLGLLIGASAFNFLLGIGLERQTRYHRWLRLAGLIQGIGCLLYFKYFNFFVDSFAGLFTRLGLHTGTGAFSILVPLGISFYTFRTISYLLDVDKGKIKAQKDWVVFFNYVAFFPCVLSGPIDKASLLMPQLERPRVFDSAQASNGMRQILWGVFKKMVIADNCALLTSQIFHNYTTLPASSLLFAVLLYTVQIYTDFSGYSDMAIGISRLLGLTVTRNFAYPLFAQNIAEFWRRWHISLTSWLTEYVFTPLNIAFRDWGKGGIILAILINFTLIGIWHGPSWTYVLFGFLHGCYYIPLILRDAMNKKQKFSKDRLAPTLKETYKMLANYLLVSLTFVLFFSDSIGQAGQYYRYLLQPSLVRMPVIPAGRMLALTTLLFAALMFWVEWVQKDKEHGLVLTAVKRTGVRYAIYYSLLFLVLLYGATANNQFIYFKF